MEKHYGIFKLDTETTYEPHGFHMKSTDRSKLIQVGSHWIETQERAEEELEELKESCCQYVIMVVYT